MTTIIDTCVSCKSLPIEVNKIIYNFANIQRGQLLYTSTIDKSKFNKNQWYFNCFYSCQNDTFVIYCPIPQTIEIYKSNILYSSFHVNDFRKLFIDDNQIFVFHKNPERISVFNTDGCLFTSFILNIPPQPGGDFYSFLCTSPKVVENEILIRIDHQSALLFYTYSKTGKLLFSFKSDVWGRESCFDSKSNVIVYERNRNGRNRIAKYNKCGALLSSIDCFISNVQHLSMIRDILHIFRYNIYNNSVEVFNQEGKLQWQTTVASYGMTYSSCGNVLKESRDSIVIKCFY
jgi:hypothetical protein